MAKIARKTAAAMAFLAITALRATTADGADRTVLLRVDNRAGVTPTSLAQAQRQAAEIYAAIGVTLVWADRSASDGGRADLELTVVLVPPGGAEAMLRGSGLSKLVLGVAPTDSGRAFIFCDRIAKLAPQAGVFEITLGRVIAHEVGHLLLPAMGHSRGGIMGAALDYQARKTPAFTPAQAESIVTFLSATR